MTRTQASTTLSQIGRGALFMLGAKGFGYGPNGLGFRVGRNSKGVNYVMIKLDDNDTYTVTAKSVRGIKITDKGQMSGVYCDQLNSALTSLTSMYTRL